MAHWLSNGHVTDDVTWSQRCCDAVRSAILAKLVFLFLLVILHIHQSALVWPCGSVTDLSRVRFSPSAAVYQRQLSVPSLQVGYWVSAKAEEYTGIPRDALASYPWLCVFDRCPAEGYTTGNVL